MDTSGTALKTALECRVGLVKPNQAELAAIADGDDWQTAQNIHAGSGTTLLVTRGAAGAWLVGEEVWEAVPPALNVSNPVGAGDSTLAGFLWATEQGHPPHEALRWAIASGSVCAAHGGPQHLTHGAVAEMLPQVSCRQVEG